MWKQSVFTLFLLFMFVVASSTTYTIKLGSDDEFNEFLHIAMVNYSEWVKVNNLDPSPVLDTKYVLETSSSSLNDVHMSCEISNQFVQGHSGPPQVSALSVSNFTGHSFQIARYYGQKYDLHGHYNCSGKMNALNYPELEDDLPFDGRGNFSFAIYQVREAVTLRNVGITEDHKFNLTHSWPTFGFMIDWRNDTRLVGQWNEELLNCNYLLDVENTFATLYVLRSLFADTDIMQPGGHLMVRYLNEVLQNVELKDVLSAENLPPSFKPTPRS